MNTLFTVFAIVILAILVSGGLVFVPIVIARFGEFLAKETSKKPPAGTNEAKK